MYTYTESAFPLAIGTSMALESLFTGVQAPYDPDREIPERIQLDSFRAFYINVETLIRNVVESVPRDQLGASIDRLEIAKRLNKEMSFIQEVASNNSDTPLVFYANDLSGAHKRHPHCLPRQFKPGTQVKARSELYDELAKQVCKEPPFKRFNIQHFKGAIVPPIKTEALIMTHFAYDLLSKINFSRLCLLESHTGKLIPPTGFNKKYKTSENCTRLPFNVAYLQIFGDSDMFSPFNKKAQAAILDIAERASWTPTVSVTQQKSDLRKMQDKLLSSVVMHMLDESI